MTKDEAIILIEAARKKMHLSKSKEYIKEQLTAASTDEIINELDYVSDPYYEEYAQLIHDEIRNRLNRLNTLEERRKRNNV